MNKIKAFFKYLWENLFDRYSIVILNVYNTIAFGALLYVLRGCYVFGNTTGALGWAFLLFTVLGVNLVFFIILTIIFFFESKGKIKRIKNNSIFNNKFYRVISILNVLNVLFYYLVFILLLIWCIILYYFEDFISYWANRIKYGL